MKAQHSRPEHMAVSTDRQQYLLGCKSVLVVEQVCLQQSIGKNAQEHHTHTIHTTVPVQPSNDDNKGIGIEN